MPPISQFFLTILILVCLVSSLNAQQCVSYSPLPFSSDLCSSLLISSQVYLPANTTLQFLDNAFSQWFSLMHSIHPVTQVNCFTSLVSLLCNTAFTPCQEKYVPELKQSVAFPLPICKSVCIQAVEECSSLWSLTSSVFDCDQTNSLTNLTLWPDLGIEANIYGINISLPCTSELPITSIPFTGTCPYPLISVHEPSGSEVPCSVGCPDPSWNEQQWDMLSQVLFVCSTIGFSLMCFLTLHFVLCPEYRTSSNRFQLYSFSSIMMFELSVTLGGPDPTDTVKCVDYLQYSTFEQPTCGAQGFLFTYFGLCSSMWLAISSSNLFVRIKNPKGFVSTTREVVYLCIVNGIAFIMSVVPASLGYIRYYWRSPICFVHGEINHGDFAYHYIFFYIPIVLITIIYLFATVLRIMLHIRNINKTFEARITGKRNLWNVNVRLFVWCILLTITFTILVIYRALLGEKHTIEKWIKQCKVLWEIGLGDDSKCPEPLIPALVSYPLSIVHYAIITSLGTFSFLVSGTKHEIYFFWYNLFLFIWNKDWNQLKDHIMKAQKRKSAASITPTPTPRPTPPSSLSLQRALSLNILPSRPLTSPISHSPVSATSIFSSNDPSLQSPSPIVSSLKEGEGEREEEYCATPLDSMNMITNDIPLATIDTTAPPPAYSPNLSDSSTSLSSSSSSSSSLSSSSSSLPYPCSPINEAIFPSSIDIFTCPTP